MLQVVHESLRRRRAAAAAPRPTPTSSTAAEATSSAGGGGGGGRVELSGDDRDALLAIRDGVLCQARHERNWAGARATAGARAGRVYFEVRPWQGRLRLWLGSGDGLVLLVEC